jgi:hypothetical protein
LFTHFSPVLLVNTIDGKLNVIEVDDINTNIKLLWSLNTGKVISTSFNDLKSKKDGMRIIPSLDGELFKYYSSLELFEKVPFDIEQILTTSYKLDPNIIFIGSIETLTIAINFKTGKIIYNCSSNSGCDESANVPLDDLFVIKQSKYLARAIFIDNGSEQWNITLTKNHIEKYPRNLQKAFYIEQSENTIHYNERKIIQILDKIEGKIKYLIFNNKKIKLNFFNFQFKIDSSLMFQRAK